MKRPHLLYFGLLAAVAIGLVVWSQSAPERGGGGRRKAGKGSSERPPVARRRPPPRVKLTGHVHTADGQPLKGATVFVMPKQQPGGVRDRLPHEVTDAAGRWTLSVRTVHGCWIGAVAPGYRNAYLDGDGVDPAVQVLHVLERAPALRVWLEDESGEPIVNKGVQLDPWPPRTCYFLPGPACRQGEQWAVSDERGEMVFRVASRGPVLLTPHVEGYHLAEPVPWVAEPQGELTLRLRANRSLHLRVRRRGDDDRTTEVVRGLASVEFADAGTGQPVFSFTGTLDAEGVLRMERAVRPGAYDLSVSVEGHAPAILSGLRLEPGETPARVTVALEPAARPATLIVRLPSQSATIDTASGRKRRRAPLTYFDPIVQEGAPPRWTPGAPEAWDAERGVLEFRLEPGHYALLVADVVGGRVATVPDLHLEAGGRLEVEAHLEAGLRFPVRDVLEDGSRTRSLAVWAAANRALPVYGLTSDGRRRVRRDVDVLGRLAEGLDVRLGPYPYPGVTLRAVQWDETVRERRYGEGVDER